MHKELKEKYLEWLEKEHHAHQDLYHELAFQGAKPTAFFISCCDSRVVSNQIFNAKIGDHFIHRNIANLVPSFKNAQANTATYASIEFAIKNLEIRKIFILGHSQCAGINALMHFDQKDPELQFVNRWLEQDQARIDLKDCCDSNEELEKESIKLSMHHLLEYPAFSDLNNKNEITITGLWIDIASGRLEICSDYEDPFVSLV